MRPRDNFWAAEWWGMSEVFSPPDDDQLAEELRAPLPRPVPDSIRLHPARLRRQAVSRGWSVLFLVLSVAAWLGRETAPMKLLGLYSPPFEYTNVLAPLVALLALWGLTSWARPGKADPYVYLRHGVPLLGRVVDLRCEVTSRVNGRDATFAYDLYVEHPDPATGDIVVTRFRTANADPGSTQLRCRVGDWLTALYLPGVPQSLMLYGLLGINPDADLVHRPAVSRRRKLLVALALAAGLMLCAALVKYQPVGDLPTVGWMALGAFLLAGGILGERAFQRSSARFEQNLREAEQTGAVQPGYLIQRPARWRNILGGLFLGPLVGVAICLGANGALDFHVPVVEDVRFKELYSTSYNFVFNTYTAKFYAPHSGEERELGISPLDLLDESPKRLQLVTHPGALGLPWQELRVTAAGE